MGFFVALAYDRAFRRERRFLDRLEPLALSDEELSRFPRRELIEHAHTSFDGTNDFY